MGLPLTSVHRLPLYLQLAIGVQEVHILSVVEVQDCVDVPATHGVVVHVLHLVCPRRSWYSVLLQPLHAETTPPKLYVPISHGTHAVKPAERAT